MSPEKCAIRIGALAPLTRPGWVDAGRQLLTGLQLGVSDTNSSGGIHGRPVELIVKDTAANPGKAVAAVDELAALGVVALAGEYHSVVARAAATRADALGLPYLCSSAVLDALTDSATNWVARISPQQSRGWHVYADYLAGAGHKRVAIAAEPSIYWDSGTRILREGMSSSGGTVIEYDARSHSPELLCRQLIGDGVTSLLLLIGNPELATSLVKTIRNNTNLSRLLIGAPAGQPELKEWASLLGADCAEIPFLRYMPENLTQLGTAVAAKLLQQLAEEPSFVAFEGYDTIAVLANIFRLHGTDRLNIANAWPNVLVNGTRGKISFSRKTKNSVWQWDAAPLQIAERDPKHLDRFHILRQF